MQTPSGNVSSNAKSEKNRSTSRQKPSSPVSPSLVEPFDDDSRQYPKSLRHPTVGGVSQDETSSLPPAGAENDRYQRDEEDEDEEKDCSSNGEEHFAINLDAVSQQLSIPIETLTEQLRKCASSSPMSSSPPFMLRGSPEATPHLSVSARGSSYQSIGGPLLLPNSVADPSRHGSSATVVNAVYIGEEITHHHSGASSVARVTTRRESGLLRVDSITCEPTSSAAAEGAHSGDHHHHPPDEAAGLLISSTAQRAKPAKKRVHFPDDVVKSITVIPVDDGGGRALHVEYNRPWFAYVLFFLSNVFFVVSWAEVMRAAWPSKWPGERLHAAVAVVSFTSFAFTSVFLLAYTLATWRPTEYERVLLRSRWFLAELARVFAFGTIAQTLLMSSFMLHITCVNSVAFTTLPLISVYLFEKLRQRAVSRLDTFGALVATVGLLILTIGEEKEDIGKRVHRVMSVVCATAGGIVMAAYLSKLRSVGKDVSNAFVITVTVLLTTGVFAGIAGAVNGYTTPLGNGDDLKSVFSDLSKEELLRVMLSGAFMFFFWFLHHTVSLYFDPLSIVAGFSMCTPMVLIVYHIEALPAMNRNMEILGGIVVAIGCSAVVVSGQHYRMRVSIPL